MNRSIGMGCTSCRPTPCPGQTEFPMEYPTALACNNTDAKANAGGISTHIVVDNLLLAEMQRRFYDAWDDDFLWDTYDEFDEWG